MPEREPTQKEFGEVTQVGDAFEIRPFGAEAVSKRAGILEFETVTEPFPYFFEVNFWINDADRSKGFAGQLMNRFEEMCVQAGVPGVTMDDVKDSQGENNGMYKKRGWVEIKRTGYRPCLVFNATQAQIEELANTLS